MSIKEARKQQHRSKPVFTVCARTFATHLARQIVKDGEGATKVVEVKVLGAPDEFSAARSARRIAESPLVKTAFHGEDPEFGVESFAQPDRLALNSNHQ